MLRSCYFRIFEILFDSAFNAVLIPGSHDCRFYWQWASSLAERILHINSVIRRLEHLYLDISARCPIYLNNGRWNSKLLGSRNVHHRVLWEELCLFILYCGVLQHHFKCSRDHFGNHWSYECLPATFWKKIQFPSHIQHGTGYWKHVVSCYAPTCVSHNLWLMLILSFI